MIQAGEGPEEEGTGLKDVVLPGLGLCQPGIYGSFS